MAVLQMTDMKVGVVARIDGDPMMVISYSQAAQGRGASVVKVKVRNIQTGAVRDLTIKGGDKFDSVDVVNQMGQFLYSAGDTYTFMDAETYDQYEFTEEQLGDAVNYLTDGLNLHIVMIDGSPIGIKLPPKVELKITETPPGVKGDTAQGGTKPATLETGYVIQVPLFVEADEVIRVNTDTGEYSERVK